MHQYRLVGRKGEGTFSEVLKAQSTVTGQYCAVKCMKSHFKSLEQVNSLREIQALRRLNPHPNIIELQEVLYDKQSGRLALVFELMDCNIYEMIKGRRQYVKPARVKMLMYQLLKAIAHMHANGIFHRDIKPENLLVRGDELKVADFGSCRGIYTRQPYTEYISTRWYRAPECLLTSGYYDKKMDMWGVGCVFFEIVALYPLFPGKNETEQIERVHSIVGTPPPHVLEQFKRHATHLRHLNIIPQEGTGIARLLPHVSPDCVDLIEQMLIYDPEKRISAKQALKHPYFKELREADARARQLQQQQQQQQLQQLQQQQQESQSTAEAKSDQTSDGTLSVQTSPELSTQATSQTAATNAGPESVTQQPQRTLTHQASTTHLLPSGMTLESTMGSTTNLNEAKRPPVHEQDEDVAVESDSKPLSIKSLHLPNHQTSAYGGVGSIAVTGGTSEYSGQLALPTEDNQEFVEEAITVAPVSGRGGGNLALAAGVRIGQHYLQRQQQAEQQPEASQGQQRLAQQYQQLQLPQEYTSNQQAAVRRGAGNAALGHNVSSHATNPRQVRQNLAASVAAGSGSIPTAATRSTKRHVSQLHTSNPALTITGASRVAAAQPTNMSTSSYALNASPSSTSLLGMPSGRTNHSLSLSSERGVAGSLSGRPRNNLSTTTTSTNASVSGLAPSFSSANLLGTGHGYGTRASVGAAGSGTTGSNLNASSTTGSGVSGLVLNGTNPLYGVSSMASSGANLQQTSGRSHTLGQIYHDLHSSSIAAPSATSARKRTQATVGASGTTATGVSTHGNHDIFASSHVPTRGLYLSNTTIPSTQALRQPYTLRAPGLR